MLPKYKLETGVTPPVSDSDSLHLELRPINILQCLVQYIADPSTGLLHSLLEQLIQSNLSFLVSPQPFQESQDTFLVLYSKLKQRVRTQA